MDNQPNNASTSSTVDVDRLQEALMAVETATTCIAEVVANWRKVRGLTRLKEFPRLEIPGHPVDNLNDIVHASDTLHASLHELNEVRKNLLSLGIRHEEET